MCIRDRDTTTGHWEIAGLKLEKPFPTYPHGFPAEVMDAFSAAIGRGWLGNKPASGTAILDELGEEHMRTGKVIVYTSGDSVFQIAAHEDIVPVEELYDMCRKARAILQGPHAVGPVSYTHLDVYKRQQLGQQTAKSRQGNRQRKGG